MTEQNILENRATSATYLRFANDEARGKSPLYEKLALKIASDNEMLEFLAALPPAKRQPNLLLAAVRYLAKSPLDWPQFRNFVLANGSDLLALMRLRSTQTNEPARCAVLLPLLAAMPGPLALLEVGASAGLCLLPDHYRYDYGGRQLVGQFANENSPIFRCEIEGSISPPSRVPEVVWRAGLDLNPLNLTCHDDVQWLEALVWPEQVERLANLRAAIARARERPPQVQRGDLREDLAALAAKAPRDATLVIFHTAVLVYLSSQADRDAFAISVRGLSDHWISNEWASVFPQLAPGWHGANDDQFLMMLDGCPIGWSDPHGSSMSGRFSRAG
ncbi:DUF2332 domain-containing protein [Ralstonia solanacearum]|uniref:DUF2332 domain-containing protein n=1 Tax=Ralstonia solanacearum TaxID=305 RepID=UPI0009C0884C|nr:DUF2332 domain-containing protein [Ralstonia solanacearum]